MISKSSIIPTEILSEANFKSITLIHGLRAAKKPEKNIA
jgi:hypothetical protein